MQLNHFRLPSEVEITLFRVLQESLTNIHRHSRWRSRHRNPIDCT